MKFTEIVLYNCLEFEYFFCQYEFDTQHAARKYGIRLLTLSEKIYWKKHLDMSIFNLMFFAVEDVFVSAAQEKGAIFF